MKYNLLRIVRMNYQSYNRLLAIKGNDTTTQDRDFPNISSLRDLSSAW